LTGKKWEKNQQRKQEKEKSQSFHKVSRGGDPVKIAKLSSPQGNRKVWGKERKLKVKNCYGADDGKEDPKNRAGQKNLTGMGGSQRSLSSILGTPPRRTHTKGWTGLKTPQGQGGALCLGQSVSFEALCRYCRAREEMGEGDGAEGVGGVETRGEFHKNFVCYRGSW